MALQGPSGFLILAKPCCILRLDPTVKRGDRRTCAPRKPCPPSPDVFQASAKFSDDFVGFFRDINDFHQDHAHRLELN